MTTNNIAANSIDLLVNGNPEEINNLRLLLSNHLNMEFINLKTLVMHLETEEDQEKREELMIFIQSTISSLEDSIGSLNTMAYGHAETP